MSTWLGSTTHLSNQRLVCVLLWSHLVDVVHIYSKLTFNEDYLWWCGWAASNGLKSLKSKNSGFPEKKEFCLKTAAWTPAWVSSLPGVLQVSDLPARYIHIHLIYPNTSNARGIVIISILHITKSKDPEMVIGQVYPAGEHSRNSYYYHGIQDLSRSGPCQCLQHLEQRLTLSRCLLKILAEWIVLWHGVKVSFVCQLG